MMMMMMNAEVMSVDKQKNEYEFSLYAEKNWIKPSKAKVLKNIRANANEIHNNGPWKKKNKIRAKTNLSSPLSHI